MRQVINFNNDWKFIKQDVGAAEAVITGGEHIDLPHTWNNLDGQDGGGDYFRGRCWYVKNFAMPDVDKDGRVFLEFKGVNSSAEVYVNGQFVTRHDGGYSTFRADVTDFLKPDNALCVCADNTPTEKVYPQTADFTFFGGIYRDVNLILTAKQHFDLLHYGAKGIKVDATVQDNYGLVTTTAYADEGEIRIEIFDAEGKAVASGANGEKLTIKDVRLWNGVKDPYLYRAQATLIVNGEVKDKIYTNFGFRYYSCDPKKGFFLNGKSYPLRGVCRHQDRKNMGNAITKKEHDEDMAMIVEIGANTIRLAHYQHDDYFYDLCDKYGLVIWAEIPYISRHMPEANDNTEQQMKELILQQYNHPSIIFWGVSNEITMFNKHKKDMLENHEKLNKLCHELDPARLTTLACFAMCGPFNKSAKITDVVSWNLYLGWYMPGKWLNKAWFGFYHLTHPNRCVGMSEYGAEAMTNLHTSHPKRGDNTEDYQAVYHEYMAEFFEKRPYIWASHLWNMFDFAADARNQGGDPGMNHKGLVTHDRKIKKDAFYIYQAYWTTQPMVHICGKRYINRTDNLTEVKIYTNQPSVELFVNGKSFGVKKANKHIVKFSVPLIGEIALKAVAGNVSDESVVRKVDTPDPDYMLHVASNNYSWEK